MVLDRQLMQDDNRGLGQGVKDSVLTLEPFKLLVERKMGDASVSGCGSRQGLIITVRCLY